MTGLLGYSRGLRVIANNTANMNTPGFKSSSLQFADMFYSGGNLSGGYASQNYSRAGFGLDTAGTTLSFKQGELRQTGNDLDMAVDGQGLFVLQDADGKISYTRAGQFKFDADGVLVSRLNGEKVMGLDEGGNFVAITLAGQMMDLGRASSRFKLAGNLPNTTTQQQPKIPVDTKYTLQVIDAAGATHTLTPRFTKGDTTSGNIPVKVELLDGTTVVSTGQLLFLNGRPTAETAMVSMTYTPAGQAPMALTLDLTEVAYWAGEYQVEMRSQDGVGAGALSGMVFDDTGTLKKTYANGRTLDGTRLALARFDSPDAVAARGNNQFEVLNKEAWHIGVAGQGAFGSLASGKIEISNVDLSQEFSDLVIMQRGYQASSQVISTANDMLQELFSMKSK
ncbi:flagellar hook protein FlgE [Variovorax beijingensis]|uniref:Flagellar hook protein FlgE n=2 Tax=Variovorax beijingensis TaxID=2496117 RepID=A0A561C3G4_9BURK|nr:flagellar hook protein FlgE [Variovorax beijingensis]